MKKKRFTRLKYIAVAAVLLFLLLPDATSNSMQITARALVTAIGVDRTAEGGFEVTAQLILPQNSTDSPQAQDFVTSKGRTVKTAVDGVTAKTGKRANLAHCKLLFLGVSALDAGLADSLDFFLRSPEIDNGIMVAAASGAAKDAVKKLSGLDKLSAFALPDFLSQNNTNGLNSVVTLKNFSESYYSGIGDLILPVIEIAEKSDGEKDEGGEEDGNPDFPAAELSDDFKTAVIKDGRLVRVLGKDDTRRLMWLDKKAKTGTLPIENGDERIALEIKGKRVKTKAVFKGGKPVYQINIFLNLSADERQGSATDIKAAAREQISADLQNLHRECIAGDFDVMRINESFFRFKNKKYKAYKAAGGDILKDCAIEVKVFPRF